jgi:lipoprotein-anchoring transpeptidase ErfK/SrfK
MWLDGMEEGVNRGPGIDSYDRYIYIHGTHEEGLIGQKASHGCIRMFNNDVIYIFNKVNKGTKVLIRA